jgi:hypothetical protein
VPSCPRGGGGQWGPRPARLRRWSTARVVGLRAHTQRGVPPGAAAAGRLARREDRASSRPRRRIRPHRGDGSHLGLAGAPALVPGLGIQRDERVTGGDCPDDPVVGNHQGARSPRRSPPSTAPARRRRGGMTRRRHCRTTPPRRGELGPAGHLRHGEHRYRGERTLRAGVRGGAGARWPALAKPPAAR